MTQKGIIGIASQEVPKHVGFETAKDSLQRPDGTLLSRMVGNNIAHNYNRVMRFALENDMDWVWLIDDDHVFVPDVLMRLLAHELPVVFPLNIRRVAPYETTIHDALDDGLRQNTWDQLRGWSGLTDIGNKNIGSSGMLIRREAIEKIGDPWYLNAHSIPENLSFDLEFSEKLRSNGYKIYVDMDTRIGHIGHIAAWPVCNKEGNWSYELRTVI